MSRSYNGHVRRDYDAGDGIIVWNDKAKKFFKNQRRRHQRRKAKQQLHMIELEDHFVYEDELSYLDEDWYEDESWYDDDRQEEDYDYLWDDYDIYYDPWADDYGDY